MNVAELYDELPIELPGDADRKCIDGSEESFGKNSRCRGNIKIGI